MLFQGKKSISLTKKEAKEKLGHYCAYQERCHLEVRQKLKSLNFYGEEAEEIIAELIVDNYINEERFARSFAGGKFRIKHWGRTKIKNELQRRNISAYCIKKAMMEIDEDDYTEKIHALIENKSSQLNESNLFTKRSKIAKFLIGKGYESSVIWPTIMDEIKD